MKSSTSKIIFILATFFFISTALGCAYMVYTIRSHGSELESRAQTVAEANAKIKSYKDLWTRYELTKAERERLSTFVLTKDETSAFLTEIETIGHEKQVSIKTNTLVVEKNKETNEETLRIEFLIEGAVAEVKKVIKLLETLPYESTLISLVLSVEEDGQARSTVGLGVTLVEYDK
jgi:hypothetical protein